MSTPTSYLSSLVGASKLIGVVGSGALTGFTFAASFDSIPAIMTADLPGDKLVKAWNNLYTIGAPYAIAAIAVSTLGFYTAAYRTYTDSIHGDDEALRLVVAGTLSVGILVFTRIFMMPRSIQRLQARLAVIEIKKGKNKEPVVDLAAIRSDIWQWSTLNKVRFALAATSFSLGLAAL